VSSYAARRARFSFTMKDGEVRRVQVKDFF
jgi:hypothetical protein